MGVSSKTSGIPRTLAQSLRAGLADGRPAEVILDYWPALESEARREPADLAAALNEAAQIDVAAGAAVLAPESAFGAAVVGAGRTARLRRPVVPGLVRTDPLDSLDFRRLMPRRRRMAAPRAWWPRATRRGGRDGRLLGEAAGMAAVGRMPGGARGGAGPVVLLAFAPSRASDGRAGDRRLRPHAAGSGLAEALLDAPTLEAAAERIGVGRETARDALRGAMRKAGARRSPDLVRRDDDLMCGDQAAPHDLQAILQSSFGATPAEASRPPPASPKA